MKIVNDFDIVDMKEKISELLAKSSMPYNSKGKGIKIFESSFPLLFAWLTIIVCHYAIIGFVKPYCKILSVISAIIIVCYMINYFVGLIADFVLTRRNREEFNTRLSKADSLGEMCDIISDIVLRFDGYIFSKPKKAIDILDIKQLKKNMEAYQRITNSEILSMDAYGDHIHLCIEDLQSHLVDRIELPAKVMESTAVEESEIHFMNWEKPTCIKKYMK